MARRLLNKALEKSNASKTLPPFVDADKILQELSEHWGFLQWSFKRIILPIVVFYIIIGLLAGEVVFGALFISLLAFLYANFLPDLDSFFPKEGKKAGWIKKRLALFFTPVFIYYLLSQKIKPLSLGSEKAFHSRKALLEFSIFLFVFGLLIYLSILKAFFLALFGFLGFLTHLLVDKQLRF